MIKNYLQYIQETLGVQYIQTPNFTTQLKIDSEVDVKIKINPMLSDDEQTVNSEASINVDGAASNVNIASAKIQPPIVIHDKLTQNILNESYSWELGYKSDARYDLIFLISQEDWFSIPTVQKELFFKIRAALKLKENKSAPAVVAKWNLETLQEFIHQTQSLTEFVLFIDDAEKIKKNPQWMHIGDKSVLLLPSLALMLKNQDWKKIAWERLKLIILKLHLI